MQQDEREILYEQGYMRGWLDARRAAREAMTDYEAKTALARVLAEQNGRDRAEVRSELDDMIGWLKKGLFRPEGTHKS